MLYQSYDVTGLLARGENVVAAIVADGWACSFYGEDTKRPRLTMPRPSSSCSWR